MSVVIYEQPPTQKLYQEKNIVYFKYVLELLSLCIMGFFYSQLGMIQSLMVLFFALQRLRPVRISSYWKKKFEIGSLCFEVPNLFVLDKRCPFALLEFDIVNQTNC